MITALLSPLLYRASSILRSSGHWGFLFTLLFDIFLEFPVPILYLFLSLSLNLILYYLLSTIFVYLSLKKILSAFEVFNYFDASPWNVFNYVHSNQFSREFFLFLIYFSAIFDRVFAIFTLLLCVVEWQHER